MAPVLPLAPVVAAKGFPVRVVVSIAAAVVLPVAVQGCAALPIAALGGAVLQSGAGAVVKTGTEYTMSGSARRTFPVPINAVRAGVLQAFERTGVVIDSAKTSDDRERLHGQLNHRTVSIRLTAFSDSLTGMTLVVKQNFLLKDRATASELLEQIEQVIAENPVFARRLQRGPNGEVAASPH